MSIASTATAIDIPRLPQASLFFRNGIRGDPDAPQAGGMGDEFSMNVK